MMTTVHVLLEGRVLCGQIHGLPSGWGPGQKWVRVEEWQAATCAVCRQSAVLGELLRAESSKRHEVMLPPGRARR